MSESVFEVVDIGRLRESPLNPRRRYDPQKLQELADSMRGDAGVIEPLVVRPGKNNGALEIVAGSRRYRAATLAGLAQVPVVVRDLDDAKVLEIMVIENDQREDTNALEQATGYAGLLKHGYSIERIAHRIGQSPKWVYDRLKLLELIPEAKELLLADKITAGHAILLARLKPEDQKRTIDPYCGGLMEGEDTLFDPTEVRSGRDHKLGRGALKDFEGCKARSVRELDAWIAEHVRLDYTAPIVADLFPETASAVKEETEGNKRPKIIQITHDNYVQPAAKEGLTGRIFTGRTWKLADGSKGHAQCDKSALGVIVLGPHRGEKLIVCANKDCKPHWGRERAEWRRMRAGSGSSANPEPRKGESPAAAAKRAAEASRQKAEQERREQEQAAWEKAVPAIVEACAKQIKTAKLANLVEITNRFFAVWGDEIDTDKLKTAKKHLGEPKSIEDLCRLLVFSFLLAELAGYDSQEEFPKRAKQLGVDVPAILKEFMPKEETKAEVQTSANLKKKKPGKKAEAR